MSKRKPVVNQLTQARDAGEKELLLGLLKQHKGNVPMVARAVGIERTNLYRRLHALDLMEELDRLRGKPLT
jgi:transcriptional regulator of acetoin/glycerol metabolism